MSKSLNLHRFYTVSVKSVYLGVPWPLALPLSIQMKMARVSVGGHVASRSALVNPNEVGKGVQGPHNAPRICSRTAPVEPNEKWTSNTVKLKQ